MKTDIKEKWVSALRSGKYEQCTGQLRNFNRFSCLGVLTDLYLKEHNKRWTVSLRESSRLPRFVVEWAGLNGGDHCVFGECLAGWNYFKGKDFEAIAGLIEGSDL